MCDEFNDISDTNDISDDIPEIDDISEGIPEINDIAEDGNDDIDEYLDSLSLDELRDLRAGLTDGQDIGEDYLNTDDLQELSEENNDVDYSFHWDGNPTHNVEWDDNDEEPTPYTKVLKR